MGRGARTGGEGGERGSGCRRLAWNRPRGLSAAKGCGGVGRWARPPGAGGGRGVGLWGEGGGGNRSDPAAVPTGAGTGGGGGGGGEAARNGEVSAERGEAAAGAGLPLAAADRGLRRRCPSR